MTFTRLQLVVQPLVKETIKDGISDSGHDEDQDQDYDNDDHDYVDDDNVTMMMMMTILWFTTFNEKRWGPLTSGRSTCQPALNENKCDDCDDCDDDCDDGDEVYDDDHGDYERMGIMIMATTVVLIFAAIEDTMTKCQNGNYKMEMVKTLANDT